MLALQLLILRIFTETTIIDYCLISNNFLSLVPQVIKPITMSNELSDEAEVPVRSHTQSC